MTSAKTTPAVTATVVAPAVPTAGALHALSPISLTAATLDPGGQLGRWQRLTADATLPHCVEHLESSGSLGNLRTLATGSGAPFAGIWFTDTDVYKTLEAAIWQGVGGPLSSFVDSAVGLIAAAQDGDGYLNSYYQLVHPEARWRDLKWGHELYCAGHLIQAAVAAARTGASPELVGVATRFADLLVERFGTGGRDGICGHPEVETALVELFRATGRRAYLDLAARMIGLRGHGLVAKEPGASTISDRGFEAQYFQDHLPVRETTAATGHAVRQLYLESGVVDVAVETQDEELLAASERIWDDLFGSKTYLTGTHGSRHRDEAIGDAYELPPDRAYAETCAAIASFHWNWRLLLATGRHRYADEMERVLYNGIAGATAIDGRHFFYSNPLQLRAGHDGSDEDAPSRRLPWYRCSCCPPNLARLVAALQGYVASTDASGVQLHLYAAGDIHASVPGGTATLRVDTNYPWDGRITVAVEECTSNRPWTLALRIPGWCTRATLDGSPVSTDDGYLRVHRSWPVSESVTLGLDMPARMVAAHPHVDAVRGCVALLRGPLVHCLEQADLDVPLDDVRLDASVAPAAVARDVLDVPVVITARGVVSSSADAPLYADAPRGVPAQMAIEVTAIPYFRWANRSPGAMRVWVPVTG